MYVSCYIRLQTIPTIRRVIAHESSLPASCSQPILFFLPAQKTSAFSVSPPPFLLLSPSPTLLFIDKQRFSSTDKHQSSSLKTREFCCYEVSIISLLPKVSFVSFSATHHLHLGMASRDSTFFGVNPFKNWPFAASPGRSELIGEPRTIS